MSPLAEPLRFTAIPSPSPPPSRRSIGCEFGTAFSAAATASGAPLPALRRPSRALNSNSGAGTTSSTSLAEPAAVGTRTLTLRP